MKPIKYTLILLFFTVISVAQNSGSIVGKLTDTEFNNEPLPFANVLIKGTQTGTTTDGDGLYTLENLQPGNYTVIFSFVGYKTQEIEATVVANKVTEINVPMGPDSAILDEVVIKTTTKRESEVALLLEQKKAVEIKQSIGSEELSRKGVGDAAAAVTKISGISKQEGTSNVYVRGLGDRYLNTTYNGLSLPSNDITKKNIDLGLFSADVIQNVSVSKAYAANFYADFAAGNINITSKNYKGNGFFDVNIGSGINTNAISKNFVKSEGPNYFGYYGRYNHNPFAVILSHGIDPERASTPINTNYSGSGGTSFNFKSGARLSFFATAGFENNYAYRKGTATDFTNVEKKAFINNAEEYEYSTTTTGMANVNFRINDENTLKYNSLFINNSGDKVGYFGIDGNGRNRDGQLNTDQGFYQMNVQFDQTQIFVNQILGDHTSGNFKVDWGFGYNLAKSRQPDRKRVSIENYHYALDSDPNTNPYFYSNDLYDNQRYFQNIEDAEYNGILNLKYNASEKIAINFGYNGRYKTRNFNNIRYAYDILDRNYAITNVNNFNNIFSLENLNITPSDNGIYEIQVFNPIPGQSVVNRPGNFENTYNGKLGIYAGYLNAEMNLTDKWLIVPGIRLESIEQNIAYDVINLVQGKNEISYNTNVFLPSLNVRYALNEDMNLRASASKTISLPEFKEVAPFVYEDVTTSIGGNPDVLGISKIWNFDLKYEWFITKSELFAVSSFYKTINNPINLVVAADATGVQRYFRTGDKATVLGIEGEFRKNIILDEDENPKLSIGVNASYMHTNQDLKRKSGTYTVSFNRSDDKLQGASPWLVNADINYSPKFNNYQPTANLVFSYFADRIDALGSGSLGNVVEKGVPTLDFIWKNNFKENFEINFSAKNLLNPNITYVRETPNGDVTVTSANGKGVSNYKKGINLGLQLKYKF